ncbi:MAG TPA: CBS domain-containing protein [Chloroflexi bacterium]|nr:CBS domain-containing protein [Chloroflexota bacterium]
MNIVGSAQKVSIHINERDRYKNQTLYTAILQHLKEEGAAGATVIRGVAGFGAHSRIHTANIVSLTDELPLVIEWVDKPGRVERILPHIKTMVSEGLITLQPIDVVRYSHRALKTFSANTPVKEMMNYEVTSIMNDASLGQVVALLVDKGHRVLPVVDKQWRVLGIISEGDLLRGGLPFVDLGEGTNQWLDTRTAANLMTAPAITISNSATVAQAIELMVTHNIKRIPVLDEDQTLTGLLSRADILRLFSMTDINRAIPPSSGKAQSKVNDVMLTDVPIVSADAPLTEIVDLLLGIRSRRVVVVDTSRRVVGIITDGDLIARVDIPHRKRLFEILFVQQSNVSFNSQLRAKDVMTQPVITAHPQDSLASALDLLMKHKIKRLPVVDETGKLVGLVGRGGILRALHSN